LLPRQTGACGLECGNILTAIDDCPIAEPAADSCVYPVILPSAQGCSQCLDTYLPAEATTIGAFYTQCVEMQCQPVCSNILNSLTCTRLTGPGAEASCLCPAVLASAAQCSSCYANVPALSAGAAAYGALLSACQKDEGTGTALATTAALTSSPTGTAAVNTAQTSATAASPAETSTTAGLTAATTASKSGANGKRAEGFASTLLNMFLFLAFAWGFMVAFV
jgi:hypothetical protein